MHKLQITKRLSDAIKLHMEASAPYVAGGFLFGSLDTSLVDVQDFAPALNVVDGLPEHFEFDREDFERASEVAQKRNMDSIGFYSSCPNSSMDLDALFINELPSNTFLLVGITNNAELVKLEVYYKGREETTACELSIAEVQEADY